MGVRVGVLEVPCTREVLVLGFCFWFVLLLHCTSGNWVNGVKSGHGAFVSGKDDSQLVGTWVNGTLTKGKWLFADGTTWHGNFKKNKPIGPGVFYFPNGTQQEGVYVEEGDPEDDEAEIKLVWRGGDIIPSTQSAADLGRV